MIKPFQFEDGGRTYSCHAADACTSPPQAWWWFDVTGDRQRYAPFRAEPKDTQASVRARVIAFYDNMLVRRATPYVSNHWGRRGAHAAAGAAQPAAAAPDVEEAAD